MAYHFYSTASDDKYYSFGQKWDNFFHLGFLGVHFFFIISGFVISYTLTKTKSLKEFVIKRIIRLLPTMILCSIITFSLVSIIDTSNLFPAAKKIKNLLFSWSFLNPGLINLLYHKSSNFEYLDGSYWSLWVEIQFYVLSSLLFFFNRKTFTRNFTSTALVIYTLHRLIQNINTSNIFHLKNKSIFVIYEKIFYSGFNLPEFILLFTIGVLFFDLYNDKRDLKSMGYLILASCLQFIFLNKLQFRIAFLLMLFLFFLFIYFPNVLNTLTWNPISKVGLASYALYLVHAEIGISLVYKYSYCLGRFNFLYPIIISLLLSAFAWLFYQFIEKPLGRKLSFLSNGAV